MRRYQALSLMLLLAIVLSGQGVGAATPTASPMATPVSLQCNEVAEYLRTIDSLQRRASEGFEETLSRNPTTLRPAQQREIAGMLANLAAEIDGMDERDIPAIASDYHQGIVEALNLMADAYVALASNDAATYLRLNNEVEAALDRVDLSREKIRMTCGFSSTAAGHRQEFPRSPRSA